MANVMDLITRSMLELGVLASGEAATGAEAQDCFNYLNSMLMSWNTDRTNIYTVNIAQYPLISGTQFYTIGPGGQFDAPRPQSIQNANIILNSVSPVTRLPLSLINDDQFAAIKVLNVQSTIPQLLYNDGAYPMSTLSLWGIPAGGLTLELFTWQALSTFLTPFDVVTLPPGYEDAIVYNLAMRIAGMFGRQPMPTTSMFAAKTLAAIQSLNTPVLLATPDASVMGTDKKSDWNYLSNT